MPRSIWKELIAAACRASHPPAPKTSSLLVSRYARMPRVLISNGKHAIGLRFLTVTEGTSYEIMSVGRRNGSYSPKPTLVRNTARPGSMGPELRTDQ
jgi:hypothetical protein